MKKFLFVLGLVLCLGFSAFALDGEGTEESPFIIRSEEDLAFLHDFPDRYFNLASDIELTEAWTSVGTLGDAFSAVFDGCGYTISGFKGGTDIGLFSANKGTIKNLNLQWTEEDGYAYTKTYSKKYYRGILCNENSGIIENCSVFGNINISITSSYNLYFGGIVGKNLGKIQNCTVDSSINITNSKASGNLYSGGITGENYNTSSSPAVVNKCRVFIDIRSSGFSDCCLCGISASHVDRYNCSKITDSYVIGSMYGAPDRMFGITNYGTVSNCYASVSGTSRGVADYNSDYTYTKVINSFYDKDVSGNTDTNYGIPKTTDVMKMKLTYTDAGWDFDNVWGISKEINNGYPYLLWEYPEKEEDVLTETQAYEFDGKLVFDVSIYANAPSKLTQIGLYGEGGRFIRNFMVPNFSSKKDVTVVIDNEEDAVSAKIFVWENTESIKPLADCEEVQIVRSEA